MTTGTIKININITNEKDTLEQILNVAHQVSKEQAQFFLLMWALAGRWHIDKIAYYMALMDEVEE